MEKEKLAKRLVEIDLDQKPLDVSGADYIEVHISSDGKTLWVNNEYSCLLRVCRIKKFHLIDDRKREE